MVQGGPHGEYLLENEATARPARKKGKGWEKGREWKGRKGEEKGKEEKKRGNR